MKLEFRAWDKEEKKMLYADSRYGSENGVNSQVLMELVADAMNGNWGGDEFTENYELMRWTCQEDTSGKKIFEGDLLELGGKDEFLAGEGTRGQVYWDNKFSKFGLKFYSIYGAEGYTGRHESLLDYIERKVHVIGNIFENPEEDNNVDNWALKF